MAERVGPPTPALVRERTVLSEHLVRLHLEPTEPWSGTGVPDEWVALTVPGQFQTRYYTVRSHVDGRLVVDVVVHEEGLVTAWAQGDCVGEQVGVSVAKGSFTLPEDATWLVLVGDLTALPATARIVEESALRATAYVEAPAGTSAAYPDLDETRADVTWLEPPSADAGGGSALADVVAGIEWPEGPGYFWMAGESSQMREIRRHLRRDVGFGADRFDVMGYWSHSRGRQTRRVDPRPAYEEEHE